MLLGMYMDPSLKGLALDEFRNGSYAEYVRMPLENTFVLDEEKLLHERGYAVPDLCYLAKVLVPFGGLADVDLKPGDSVLISPATGGFGGAAVTMALAMGAFVVAAGRNEETLKRIVETYGGTGRISYVKLQGSTDADVKALKAASPSCRGFDVFIDFSPPSSGSSPNVKSCILAVKPSGKCALMGGQREDVPIPYRYIMRANLRLQGRFMYTREMIPRAIRMVEGGIL